MGRGVEGMRSSSSRAAATAYSSVRARPSAHAFAPASSPRAWRTAATARSYRSRTPGATGAPRASRAAAAAPIEARGLPRPPHGMREAGYPIQAKGQVRLVARVVQQRQTLRVQGGGLSILAPIAPDVAESRQRESAAAFVSQFTERAQALLEERDRPVDIALFVGQVSQVVEQEGDTPRFSGLPAHGQGLPIQLLRPAIVALLVRRFAQVIEQGRDPGRVAQRPLQLQALLEQCAGPRVVASILREGAQVAERGDDARLIVQRAKEGEAAFQQRGGGGVVALIQGQRPRCMIGVRQRRGVGVARPISGERQQSIEPRAPLAQMATHVPKGIQRGCQPQPGPALPALLGPAQRGAQVVVLALQPLQPHRPRGPVQLWSGGLGQQGVIGCVRPAQRFPLATRRQPLQGVLAHCFEHAHAHLAVDILFCAQEALVDQRGQSPQHVASGFRQVPALRGAPAIVYSRAHLLRRLEGAAADEDGQSPEKGLLVPVEDVVAPGDGVAHRAQPLRQVLSPTRQQLQG